MSGSVDWASIAEALARPGMDPREWLCWGTVATMDDEGDAHYDDPHAIHQGPEGVEVDVYLETLDKLVTCHYPGIQGGGRVYVGAPIGPGDRVVVGMPEGDTGGCVILAIGNGASDPVPLGDDKKPIFQNDRLLVWSESYPVDIRIQDGPSILAEPSGTVTIDAAHVKVGSANAAQKAVLGDAQKAKMDDVLSKLTAALATVSGVASDGGLAISAASESMGSMISADYLATKVTVE